MGESQANAPIPTRNLRLSEHAIGAILSTLAEKPYGQVAGLIREISDQVTAQIIADQQPKTGTGTMAPPSDLATKGEVDAAEAGRG